MAGSTTALVQTHPIAPTAVHLHPVLGMIYAEGDGTPARRHLIKGRMGVSVRAEPLDWLMACRLPPLPTPRLIRRLLRCS